MTWLDWVLLVVALLIPIAFVVVYYLARRHKPTLEPVVEIEEPPPKQVTAEAFAAAAGIILAPGQRGKKRVVDPGRGLATAAARKAARNAAWKPSSAARRAAHKALWQAGMDDEREVMPDAQ